MEQVCQELNVLGAEQVHVVMKLRGEGAVSIQTREFDLEPVRIDMLLADRKRHPARRSLRSLPAEIKTKGEKVCAARGVFRRRPVKFVTKIFLSLEGGARRLVELFDQIGETACF